METNLNTTTIKSDIKAIDSKITNIIENILDFGTNKKEEFKEMILSENSSIRVEDIENIKNKDLISLYFSVTTNDFLSDVKGREKKISKAVFDDLMVIQRNLKLIIDINFNSFSSVEKLELIKVCDKVFRVDKNGNLVTPKIETKPNPDGGLIYVNTNAPLISKTQLEKLSIQKDEAGVYVFNVRLLTAYLKDLVTNNAENLATYKELAKLNK